MSESLNGGLGAVGPELCRVSVLGGNTQVDLGLPTMIPVAAFIDDVVDLIGSRNPDLTEHEDGVPLEAQHWTLARIGRSAIPSNETLTEAEVFDGELLVLRSTTDKESPALFDDVIDAVSKLTTESFDHWSQASARWLGLVAALVAVLASISLLVVAKADGASTANAIMTLSAGVTAAVSAAIAIRKYQVRLAAVMLSLVAMLLFFSSGVLFVPGELGSPHFLLASVMMLVAGAIGYTVVQVGATMFTALITLALFGGCSAFVRMVWEADCPNIGAGVLVAALTVITIAPRIAVGTARLPVPPVPTAGGAIDPADHEPRPTIEDIGAIGATALPSAVGLERRARAANEYQSGMLIGCTTATVAAAVVTVDPLGASHWPNIILALVLALILCLRGRSFADLTQASWLIGGGAFTLVASTVSVAFSDRAILVPTAGILLIVATAMVVFGVIGPSTEMSPVTRRIGEILEYLLICAVVPLVLWVLDMYSAARNL